MGDMTLDPTEADASIGITNRGLVSGWTANDSEEQNERLPQIPAQQRT